MKRSPIRPRSKKRSEEYVKRRALVEQLLGERGWCEACPVFAGFDNKTSYIRNRSQDIHELVRRSQGGSILDIENLLAICRPCHRRINENPNLAIRLGLHIPGWAMRADPKTLAGTYIVPWPWGDAEVVRVGWSRGVPARPKWYQDDDD